MKYINVMTILNNNIIKTIKDKEINTFLFILRC